VSSSISFGHGGRVRRVEDDAQGALGVVFKGRGERDQVAEARRVHVCLCEVEVDGHDAYAGGLGCEGCVGWREGVQVSGRECGDGDVVADRLGGLESGDFDARLVV
jgi:hypothetical protein